MDFGVTFPARVGDFELVELAERLGYSQAWFYDSQMIYSDVYATMALAAHKTSKIRLGTGVAVPTTRMAPTIAHSIATINQLAPGRVELGVGTGNTARLTMGLRPITLTRMKQEVRLIQALLAGETGTLREEGEEHAVRFLHPHRNYINLKDHVTVSISALGPKTLAYCGSESDGHITWGIDPDGLRAARSIIDEAAHKRGKTPSDVPSKCFFPTAVLAPGETTVTPRIMSLVAPFIMNFLHVQVEWGTDLLPPIPAVAEWVERYKKYAAGLPADTRHLRLHEGHIIYPREDEQEFIVPELADVVAIVGEPDEVIERIHALEDAGLSHFAFQVMDDDPVRQMTDFAEKVMAKY